MDSDWSGSWRFDCHSKRNLSSLYIGLEGNKIDFVKKKNHYYESRHQNRNKYFGFCRITSKPNGTLLVNPFGCHIIGPSTICQYDKNIWRNYKTDFNLRFEIWFFHVKNHCHTHFVHTSRKKFVEMNNKWAMLTPSINVDMKIRISLRMRFCLCCDVAIRWRYWPMSCQIFFLIFLSLSLSIYIVHILSIRLSSTPSPFRWFWFIH